jgi:predicted permease
MQEESRGAWQFKYLEQMSTDIRYAFRQLWNNPGFTLTAVVSLALGIGTTTAVFSVVYAVLIEPFPYVAADQIVRISTDDKGHNLRPVSLTGSQLQLVRKATCVKSAVAWLNWELNTTGNDLPEDVKAVFITPNASNYFGVRPLQGRGLTPADAPATGDAQPVVLLTYSFWNRHFGRSPDMIGKSLEMSHKEYRIIGVLPRRFAWNGGDVYLPLKITYDQSQLYGISIRLKPSISLQAAASELQSLFQQFAKETPTRYPESFRIHLERLNDQYVNSLGRTLYLLFGAVVLLLIIGCSNLSILLLARGTARQQELAIRVAIGASRGRMLRQLLTESVTLSLSGAALGVLTAYATVALIVKWLPDFSLAREVAVQINLPVLTFCVLLALPTGILFGLSPALQMVRPQLERTLRSSMRKIAGGDGTKRKHNMLIAGQIALTLLLLTGAGSSIQGFRRVTHVRLGYRPQKTLDVSIPLHTNSYVKQEERAVYFETIRRRVAAIPGISSVALTDNAVPPFGGAQQHVELLNELSRQWREASLNLVSANYFSTLGIALSRGRVWDEVEEKRGARLAVINEAMARQFWPHGDPVGNAIRFPELKPQPPFRVSIPGSDGWVRITGVVADSQNDGLLAPVKPAVYIPSTIWMDMGIDLLVHVQTSPSSVLHVIRKQLALINPDQQTSEYTPSLDELIQLQPEWQQERLVTLLCGGFAAIALILAVVGLYSVVSYSVAQRTNEFGIRMALGASRERVLSVVLSSFSPSVGIGIGIGALLALGLDSFLTKLAQGTDGHPAIVIAVAFLLVTACTCACVVPAWRAASVDPMTALRHE